MATTSTQAQIQQPVTVPIVPTSKPESAVISLSDYAPSTKTVSATSGQYPNLPVLVFDVRPSNDGQQVNSLTVNLRNSGQGSINTANLYSSLYNDGYNNRIATAVIANGSATFSNIRSIPSLNVTSSPYNTFRVSVDVSGLTDISSSMSVSASVSDIKISDSKGRSINVSGTADGYVTTVTGNPYTLTLSQMQWLKDKNLQLKDVLHDGSGYYVTVTSNMGSQSKLYLPQ